MTVEEMRKILALPIVDKAVDGTKLVLKSIIDGNYSSSRVERIASEDYYLLDFVEPSDLILTPPLYQIDSGKYNESDYKIETELYNQMNIDILEAKAFNDSQNFEKIMFFGLSYSYVYEYLFSVMKYLSFAKKDIEDDSLYKRTYYCPITYEELIDTLSKSKDIKLINASVLKYGQYESAYLVSYGPTLKKRKK